MSDIRRRLSGMASGLGVSLDRLADYEEASAIGARVVHVLRDARLDRLERVVREVAEYLERPRHSREGLERALEQARRELRATQQPERGEIERAEIPGAPVNQAPGAPGGCALKRPDDVDGRALCRACGWAWFMHEASGGVVVDGGDNGGVWVEGVDWWAEWIREHGRSGDARRGIATVVERAIAVGRRLERMKLDAKAMARHASNLYAGLAARIDATEDGRRQVLAAARAWLAGLEGVRANDAGIQADFAEGGPVHRAAGGPGRAESASERRDGAQGAEAREYTRTPGISARGDAGEPDSGDPARRAAETAIAGDEHPLERFRRVLDDHGERLAVLEETDPALELLADQLEDIRREALPKRLDRLERLEEQLREGAPLSRLDQLERVVGQLRLDLERAASAPFQALTVGEVEEGAGEGAIAAPGGDEDALGRIAEQLATLDSKIGGLHATLRRLERSEKRKPEPPEAPAAGTVEVPAREPALALEGDCGAPAAATLRGERAACDRVWTSPMSGDALCGTCGEPMHTHESEAERGPADEQRDAEAKAGVG